MNIAIVGCGAIGQKRAKNLAGCHLVACVDQIKERAENLAKHFPSCIALTDWQEVIKRPDIDIIIIATLHANLAEIGLAAVNAGKHVLLEKPGGRRAAELDPMMAAATKSGSLVRVGFNHRYHRALQKARKLIDENSLGELMFIRGRYGHGGR